MSRISGFDPGDDSLVADQEELGYEESPTKRSRGNKEAGSGGPARLPLSSISPPINKTDAGREYSAKKKEREKEKSRKPGDKEVYEYFTLSEIAEDLKINMAKKDNYRRYNVDTYGVVVSFTQPREITGKGRKYNKYVASYFLADPSQKESFEANVNLNVFGNTLEEFPFVRSVGDVLRCHRINAQFYNGLQLIGPVNQSKFVTFHRKFDPTTGLENKSANLGDAYHGDRHYNSGRMLNKARLTNLPPESYGVYATSKEFTFVNADYKRVTQFSKWSTAMTACRSLKDKMTDMLSLRSAVEAFQEYKGVNAEKLTCDVIAVFVGTIGAAGTGTDEKPAEGVKAVFWDGTVPGSVGVSEDDDPEITSETLRAMNQAMHASAVYGETSMVEYEEFLTLKDRVVLPHDEEDLKVLYSGTASFHVSGHFTQQQFARMVPGTWVRLRNLLVLSTNNRFSGLDAPSIDSETHVLAMPPYAVDPVRIAQQFKVSIGAVASAVSAQGAQYRQASQVAAQRMQEGDYDHASAVEIVEDSIRGKERAAGEAARAPEAARSRALVSDTGEELTALTLIQGTPAPAKFCCRSKITGYYPRDLSRWVVNLSHFREEIIEATGGDTTAVPRWADDSIEAGGGGSSSSSSKSGGEGLETLNVDDLLSGVSLSAQPSHPKKAFLFSLSIADDTAETDVIFSGKDAQFFLNDTSPDKFNAALLGGDDGEGVERLVEDTQRRLDDMIKDQTVLQFYIRSYIDKTSDPNPNAKGLKRLSAYNTRMGGGL